MVNKKINKSSTSLQCNNILDDICPDEESLDRGLARTGSFPRTLLALSHLPNHLDADQDQKHQ